MGGRPWQVLPHRGGHTAPADAESGHLECGRAHGATHAAPGPEFRAGDPDLKGLQVLLLQEVVAELGVHFHEDHGWVHVYGKSKNRGDWRGTAVAYRDQATKHTNTQLLAGGIATTPTTRHGTRGVRYRPHPPSDGSNPWSLGAWETTLRKARVILGSTATRLSRIRTAKAGERESPQTIA